MRPTTDSRTASETAPCRRTRPDAAEHRAVTPTAPSADCKRRANASLPSRPRTRSTAACGQLSTTRTWAVGTGFGAQKAEPWATLAPFDDGTADCDQVAKVSSARRLARAGSVAGHPPRRFTPVTRAHLCAEVLCNMQGIPVLVPRPAALQERNPNPEHEQ